MLVGGAVDRVQQPRQGALQLGANVVFVQPHHQAQAAAHKDGLLPHLVDADQPAWDEPPLAQDERLEDETARVRGRVRVRVRVGVGVGVGVGVRVRLGLGFRLG